MTPETSRQRQQLPGALADCRLRANSFIAARRTMHCGGQGPSTTGLPPSWDAGCGPNTRPLGDPGQSPAEEETREGSWVPQPQDPHESTRLPSQQLGFARLRSFSEKGKFYQRNKTLGALCAGCLAPSTCPLLAISQKKARSCPQIPV